MTADVHREVGQVNLPVMLSVVPIVKRTRGWYERGAAAKQG
ncbi:hypothetical protein FHW79_005481 [Azospirillum sp. OGB3]|nr:hypothetical protein [Azospirillum sp. OGB3]MBB3267816.1 hypothetical protein [Azospirillum sp. OGB3]